jgi:hypothetical protein
VTINQAAGQADPTSASPVNYTVVFSESVTGFDSTDLIFTGTAPGPRIATVTGSGTTYNVAVTGMTGNGTVQPSIAAGRAADAAGNGNTASTSTDNTVSYDITAPTVTINQAAGQADPTSVPTVNFTVVFSESVTGFTGADVTVGGTAPGTITVTVTGAGPTYNVAISGMTSSGTVIPSIAAGGAADTAGNSNTVATSTDNSVDYIDTTAPTVLLNRVGPVTAWVTPLQFTAVFSEPVTGFDGSDITFTGTAPGTKTATVTGSGTTYGVAITGMTSDGTVVPGLAAGQAVDLAGNPNTIATGTQNSVTYSDNTAPIVTITSFTPTGSTVTASGTGGISPGDSGTITVVLCTSGTGQGCNTNNTVATLTTTRDGTGAWTVTSGALGPHPTLYARATQVDLKGNSFTSVALGPRSTT